MNETLSKVAFYVLLVMAVAVIVCAFVVYIQHPVWGYVLLALGLSVGIFAVIFYIKSLKATIVKLREQLGKK